MFGCALIIVSVFSYYPYYAAALLITLFLILIFLAFKPWKPGFFRNKHNFYLVRESADAKLRSVFLAPTPSNIASSPLLLQIIVLIFMLIMAWIIAAVTRDVCIASNPYSVSVYQTRKLRGDSCGTWYSCSASIQDLYSSNLQPNVVHRKPLTNSCPSCPLQTTLPPLPATSTSPSEPMLLLVSSSTTIRLQTTAIRSSNIQSTAP